MGAGGDEPVPVGCVQLVCDTARLLKLVPVQLQEGTCLVSALGTESIRRLPTPVCVCVCVCVDHATP